MSDPMGLFRVDIAVENPSRPGERAAVPSVLVDTGAELSWIPGDLVLLGSRTLEGLNVRVEPVTKQLVDAGPAPAAAA
ncbi:MAG: hypothetical protein Q8Q14_15200 [Gemmatimonadales bacterium]|nr:hypothetical protein [Gemmatimonadales bacterium]